MWSWQFNQRTAIALISKRALHLEWNVLQYSISMGKSLPLYRWFVRDDSKVIVNTDLNAASGKLRNVLQWRWNERDGVSNHQPQDCLLKH